MYDPKCYELAEYFLANNGAATSKHIAELAQDIQDAVEDYNDDNELSEEYPDNGPTDPAETSGPGRGA